MKRRWWLAALVSVFLLSGAAPARPTSEPPDLGWEAAAPGIAWRRFDLPQPNQVWVARLERGRSNVFIESAIARGQLGPVSSGYKTETVTSMADRYDDALNSWGAPWSGTNQVVVAINGYFFGSDGVPWRGQIQAGGYAKRFDDHENGSGFAWKQDGGAFIGGCVAHPAEKQLITLADGRSRAYDGLNVARGRDQVIVYTSHWGAYTPASEKRALLEVTVRLNGPLALAPASAPLRGVVTASAEGRGETPILFDEVVLSADGEARAFLAGLTPGATVSLAQTIRNCPTSPSQAAWEGTYASIGGSFDYLRAGEIQSFSDYGANVRNPRTAVAYNEDYVYFIVVDGRNPSQSVGMTMTELGQFSRDTLGATDGVNQDGGGSSTLVINGQVVNNTYCNNIFCQGRVYIPLVAQSAIRYIRTPYTSLTIPPWDDPSVFVTPTAPPPPPLPSSAATPAPPPSREALPALAQGSQRAVANALLMVVQQPRQQSRQFQGGQRVRTLEAANLRTGPGLHFPTLTTLPPAATGIILTAPSGLDGLIAGEHAWWLAEFQAASGTLLGRGWISASLLAPINP
jgi:hypothetical protein